MEILLWYRSHHRAGPGIFSIDEIVNSRPALRLETAVFLLSPPGTGQAKRIWLFHRPLRYGRLCQVVCYCSMLWCQIVFWCQLSVRLYSRMMWEGHRRYGLLLCLTLGDHTWLHLLKVWRYPSVFWFWYEKVDERTGPNILINPADIQSLPDLEILRGWLPFSVILSYNSLLIPSTVIFSPARRYFSRPSGVW